MNTNELSQSDTSRLSTLPEEKSEKYRAKRDLSCCDSAALNKYSDQQFQRLHLGLLMTSLLDPQKIHTKRNPIPNTAFPHDSVSTATLRLPTYLHLNLRQQIFTTSQQISSRFTTFHPSCHLPCCGNLLPSNSAAR